MSLPVLYSFRRCPYAMRARLALTFAQQVVELREVVLRDKPPQLIACSPKATVPVLVLADGTVIDESLDIMLWALAAPEPELAMLGQSKQEQLALIAANDGVFKQALDRYKYPNRFQDEFPGVELADIERQARQQAEGFLQQLEQRLQGGQYLQGAALSLADIAILPFVRQFAFVDKAWFDQAPYLRVQQWLAEFLGSALFAAVMPKFTAWQAGDEPLLFGRPAKDS